MAYRVYVAGARSRKEVPLHSQNAWHSTHLATENPRKSIEIAGVYASALMMHQPTQMREVFNAVAFVAQVKSGELDGRLVEELRKLSEDELEEVVGLIVEERLNKLQLDQSACG